jgi:glycosyltransferase involved in cell wall biosynthesis
VPAGDDAALARAIVQAVTDVDEARRRTAVARQLVETRFSLKRMIEAHHALYRRMLMSPSGQAA